MRRLLLALSFLFIVTQIQAQTQVSDAHVKKSFKYLNGPLNHSHIYIIDGERHLIMATNEYIIKMNLDDSESQPEYIDHRSECFSSTVFYANSLLTSSSCDIYELDIITGDVIFHLELERTDIYGVRKVGEHYFMRGFKYNAIYNTELNDLIELPHSQHYEVLGDQLVTIESNDDESEIDGLAHVNLSDGSIVVDFDEEEIVSHTLSQVSPDTEKLFFTTESKALYEVDLSDFSIQQHCTSFELFERELFYDGSTLYMINKVIAGTAGVINARIVDINDCGKGDRVGYFPIELVEEFEEVINFTGTSGYVVKTNRGMYYMDSNEGLEESFRLNAGSIRGFAVKEDKVFAISNIDDDIHLVGYDSEGILVFGEFLDGEPLQTLINPDDLVFLYVEDDDLKRIEISEEGTYQIINTPKSGVLIGPYEESEWKYRNGYFYSFIDNQLHYQLQGGLVEYLSELSWKGTPWINGDGQAVGITEIQGQQQCVIYDLVEKSIVKSSSLNIDNETRAVVQLGEIYYLFTTSHVYALDIQSGSLEEVMEMDFIPYLTSEQRTIGRERNDFTQTSRFVSFDGNDTEVLYESSSSFLQVIPIKQESGFYQIQGLQPHVFFNETTDDLTIIPKEGFYYSTNEVRYNGENCFIDINNEWVYYYTEDTVVQKPLLIEGDEQLVFGYVANNHIFASSTPFDKSYGIPYVQTSEDDVLSLESLIGEVSVCDAMYSNGRYYILSFDVEFVYLHEINADFTESTELDVFPRSTNHFHEGFYFLGTDLEGDINFRITDRTFGSRFYQYQFEKSKTGLLFDPSAAADDIGLLKYYDDKGLYFCANDGGENHQIWTLPYDLNPSSSKDLSDKDKGKNLIYPNPFIDNLRFKTSVRNVEILDISGRKMIGVLTNNNAIDQISGLSQLNQGVYIVRYQLGDQVRSEKVVKL